MSDLNKKIAKGAAWMVLFKVAGQLLGLISTVVLARLLEPAEFGVVAMAMSLIALLELMRNFNFDVMLIQKQDADSNHYNTAWTFNVILGFLVALLLTVLAGPTAKFYSEPGLVGVIYVLAVGTAVQGFENIGTVNFRKEMRFDREFRFLMLRRLSGFIVTIPLAIILRNYWALVIGMLTMRLTSVVSSYLMSDYRPWFSMKARGELFSFSVWLFLLNILQFSWVRSADFIIGRIAGARMLGIFSISYQLSNLPTTELVAPVNRAIFPGYALISGDRSRLRQGYLNVLSMISLLTLPTGAGMAVVAPVLVPVLLGPDWSEAAPVMAILAFFGVTTALLANSGSIFMAIGKPMYLTGLSGLRLVVLVPVLMYATSNYGVIGAAFSYLAVSLLFMPLIYFLLFKLLDLGLFEFLSVIWRPLVATLVMYWGVRQYLALIEAGSVLLNEFGALITSVGLGVILYVLALGCCWRLAGRPDGAEKIVLNQVRIGIARVAKKMDSRGGI